MNTPISLKKKLFELCTEAVQQRIGNIRAAIKDAQESANEETKSSSGDKYETGRAMMQLEIENLNGQLNEAIKLKETLFSIRVNSEMRAAEPGALVITDAASYFLTVSVGKLTLDHKDYFAVGMTTPIAQALAGSHVNDLVTFNDRKIKILEIV